MLRKAIAWWKLKRARSYADGVEFKLEFWETSPEAPEFTSDGASRAEVVHHLHAELEKALVTKQERQAEYQLL